MGPSVRVSLVALACSACSVISADGFTGAQDPEQSPPPRQTTDGFDAGDDAGGGATGGHGDRPPAPPPPPAGDAGDDGGGTGLTPKSTFTDAFARPDGPTIGNGWVPKIASKFSLLGGQVLESNSDMVSYKDLLVHRPSTEAALDVDISVDATLPPAGGDTCLYARVQPASDTTGSLVSYTFYPWTPTVAYLDHDIGAGTSLPVSSMGLNPPLVGGQTIHMVLRVIGTSPVHIYASISDTNGTVLGTLSVDDNTASPIITAGTYGFGSGGSSSKFDNFRALVY